MNRRRAMTAVLVSLTIAALTGCTGQGVASSPTQKASSSAISDPSGAPAASPGATKIVLGANKLLIEDASGATLESFAYSEHSADIVPALTKIFSASPVRKYEAEAKCQPEGVSVTWKDLSLFYYGKDLASASAILVTTRTAPGAIAIQSPGGAVVGGSWSSYFASVSSHLSYPTGQYTSVLDSASDGKTDTGTIVDAKDGTITTISAPLYFYHDC